MFPTKKIQANVINIFQRYKFVVDFILALVPGLNLNFLRAVWGLGKEREREKLLDIACLKQEKNSNLQNVEQMLWHCDKWLQMLSGAFHDML